MVTKRKITVSPSFQKVLTKLGLGILIFASIAGYNGVSSHRRVQPTSTEKQRSLLVVPTANSHISNNTTNLGKDTKALDALCAAAAANCSSTTLSQTNLTAVVDKLLRYNFFLDKRALQRGVYSYGDSSRLRRFANKLLNGDKVLVAGLGTSILAGAVADRGGVPQSEKTRSLFWKVHHWLYPYFPNAKFVNMAAGASSAVIHDACFDQMMLPDFDLLILEESTHNDISLFTPGQFKWQQEDLGSDGTFKRESRLAFERLLRKGLQMKNQPAVIVIHSYSYRNAAGTYHKAIENDYNVIASYYSIPTLSVRSAVYHYMRTNQPGFRVDKHRKTFLNVTDNRTDYFMWDHIHPYGPTGHRAMGDLIINLLQNTFKSLVEEPYTVEDEVHAVEPLPPPMIRGNYELSNSCLINKAMRDAMTSKDPSFQWISERPSAENVNDQKWGWISTVPGAWIRFTFDTRTSEGAKNDTKSMRKSMLSVSYLRSYNQMGRFQVACVENCTCDSKLFNGHWSKHVSTTESQHIQVTQHQYCGVQFTIANETSSGEHKVKLIGVTVMAQSNKNILARRLPG